LSWKFLNEAKALQPSDASGFEETAKVYNSDKTFKYLLMIDEFYTSRSNIKPSELYQVVFDNYVTMASMMIEDNNYTDALLLLNNSFIIHNWFDVTLSNEYNTLVSHALDGVASSYLKVGYMALQANNNTLAFTYFDKADNIVLSNKEIYKSLKHSDAAFANYFNLQYKIAMQFINAKDYDEALKRISFGAGICLKSKKTEYCKSIKLAECLAHSGKIKQKLDSLKELIISNQYPSAFDELSPTYNYLKTNSCKFTTDSIVFSDNAYSLFLEFLQNGEILIEAQQSEMALYNLLKAKSIESNYLPDELDKLKLLMQFAAEPEINRLIDEAKYHTWANRMDKAEELLIKAVDLNQKYFRNKNSRVTQALNNLSTQMSTRSCLTYKTKYDDAIKKVSIAAKYHKFSKIDKLLKEAEKYVNDFPDCELSDRECVLLRIKYGDVIEFYNRYNSVIKILFENGYSSVIDNYIALEKFYNDKNIESFGITFIDIRSFIVKQNSLKLTASTTQYYLDDGNSLIALDYIRIYKYQGGKAKDMRQLINQIARNIALLDEDLNKPVGQALHEYTDDDGWFNGFKITYLKNRIVN